MNWRGFTAFRKGRREKNKVKALNFGGKKKVMPINNGNWEVIYTQKKEGRKVKGESS